VGRLLPGWVSVGHCPLVSCGPNATVGDGNTVQAAVDTPLETAVAFPVAPGHRIYYLAVKRLLDVLVSAIALIGTVPLCLLIGLAIKLDSPGPIFFVQERVGLNGRRFRFYKFRSMMVDAEARREELRDRNEADGPVFKIRNDPRVTRVGRFLRRSSLDELPQFFNVLRGEMTLVGPRPPLPAEVEQYRPQDAVRLTVKPGLTCLWVIRGRSDCDFDRWMEYDREYIQRLSFWLDLTILAGTVAIAITGRGAY
jgi:exopolysaccharide biosynthesis polyprenyl glycosylphosphotransferase